MVFAGAVPHNLSMKTIPLLLGIVLACSSLTAGAATMAISAHQGQNVTVQFTFGSADLAPSNASFTFATAKGLLGSSNNPTDQSGFKNSAHDLFAITVIPATKAAFVYFFLTTSKGDIHLLSDVNRRVSKFLSQPWRDDANGFLRVERIHGRKVELSTTDYAHAPFKTHAFWVRVDEEGEITFL